MSVEKLAMTLLSDLQRELRRGLNSLGRSRKLSKGLHDNYLFYSASHINRAVEGFLFLRKGSRIDAAKLAIRSAIEAMLRIRAVQKKPELLYRIAYTERLEIKRWVRPAARRQGKDYDEAANECQWTEFKGMYKEQFPNHRLEDKRLSLVDAAKLAGLEP